MERPEALDRFYELVDDLRRRCGGYRYLADCDGFMRWPQRGVYFFFEEGETRANGEHLRITRVGTHALKVGSQTTLWKRLSAHRGSLSGKYAGGGNHRGSVFRLHVGTALLTDPRWSDSRPQLTWAQGGSAPAQVRLEEHHLEQAVSGLIGRMPFLWVGVPDPPGPKSHRALIEKNSIALLSNHSRVPIDPPSPEWLGLAALSPAVKTSGLWNVNHVQDEVDLGFLPIFQERISEM